MLRPNHTEPTKPDRDLPDLIEQESQFESLLLENGGRLGHIARCYAHGWSLATLYYTLFVLGLYFAIYHLNQRAATRKIAPQIKQIDAQILELKQGEIL